MEQWAAMCQTRQAMHPVLVLTALHAYTAGNMLDLSQAALASGSWHVPSS